MIRVDAVSLLVDTAASATLDQVEASASALGLTLAVEGLDQRGSHPVGDWIGGGAHGAFDPWADPADHLVAGFEADLPDGRHLVVRPSPRRSVGPDLFALFLGTGHRYGRLTRLWLRVHRKDTSPAFVRSARAGTFAPEGPGDGPLSDGERQILDALAGELGRRQSGEDVI